MTACSNFGIWSCNAFTSLTVFAGVWSVAGLSREPTELAALPTAGARGFDTLASFTGVETTPLSDDVASATDATPLSAFIASTSGTAGVNGS